MRDNHKRTSTVKHVREPTDSLYTCTTCEVFWNAGGTSSTNCWCCEKEGTPAVDILCDGDGTVLCAP